MKSLIRLTDMSASYVDTVFSIADEINKNSERYSNCLEGKTVVVFFPEASIRTRVTFEKAVASLGGTCFRFPSSALDKSESVKDVISYLNNWADIIVVRHKSIYVIEEIDKYFDGPVINAMTDVNHPCEVLSDLYSLSHIRDRYKSDKYLYVGPNSNIGLAWKEASELLKLDFSQVCPAGYEMENVLATNDLNEAIKNKDIVLTDCPDANNPTAFEPYMITSEIMRQANPGALLNCCPPFIRGREVSSEVVDDSEFFVGYKFKASLLSISQAVLVLLT